MGGLSIKHRLLILFLIGLAISLLMLVRSQVNDDALHLLSRGWLLAKHGVLAPIGNAAAERAGGFVPGSVSAIVTGIPLMLWMDHRAPVVLILLTHIIAYLLLDRVIKAECDDRARLILAVVFWLNPWRMYQSGWVDNSNYVFVAGAIHLWASYAQRERPKFWHSTLLVATAGLALQLHLDAFILVIAAIALWLRGYWKPHWGGAALGAVLTLLSLVPFLIAAYHHPQIIPGGSEPLGKNLVKVWPVLKGFSYWLRYASLYSAKDTMVFDFAPALGSAIGPGFSVVFRGYAYAAAMASMGVAIMANWWWLRGLKGSSKKRHLPAPASAWLSGYALWLLAACLLANALSPEVTMWWHNLIALHAAIIPVILWTVAVQKTPRATLAGKTSLAYAIVAIVLCLGMALGGAHYRRGGEQPVSFPEAGHRRLAEDLALYDCCTPSDMKWKPKQKFFYWNYLYRYLIDEPAL